MIRYFQFAAKTKVLILTFIGIFFFALVIFPNIPLGAETLDTQFQYDFMLVQKLMAQYGKDGRYTYLIMSSTLDMLFPLIYGTFFAGLIYRFRINNLFGWFAVISVIAGCTDLSENIQVITLLLQYPDISQGLVQSASWATKIKWNMVIVTNLIAATCVLLAAGKFVAKKFEK